MSRYAISRFPVSIERNQYFHYRLNREKLLDLVTSKIMTHDPNDINIHGNITGEYVNIGGTQIVNYSTVNNYIQQDTLADISAETVIEAFHSTTARLANIRGTFAQTEISIKRRDVQKILDWVSQSPSNQEEFKYRLALITGKPGQGKSVVMQQLALVIRDAGYTILNRFYRSVICRHYFNCQRQLSNV
jgi:hypothetical protein